MQKRTPMRDKVKKMILSNKRMAMTMLSVRFLVLKYDEIYLKI